MSGGIVKLALRRPLHFRRDGALDRAARRGVDQEHADDIFPEIDIPVVTVVWQKGRAWPLRRSNGEADHDLQHTISSAVVRRTSSRKHWRVSRSFAFPFNQMYTSIPPSRRRCRKRFCGACLRGRSRHSWSVARRVKRFPYYSSRRTQNPERSAALQITAFMRVARSAPVAARHFRFRMAESRDKSHPLRIWIRSSCYPKGLSPLDVGNAANAQNLTLPTALRKSANANLPSA